MNINQSTTLQICVLMSSYNGEKFIAEQLQSIENQTYQNWKVIISDDGSSDDTLKIVHKFQRKWSRDKLEIRTGPKQGFCQNFLSMACDNGIRADLYAFSDQDDVWMPDKLQRAVAYFSMYNEIQLPRAYGSRTQIVNSSLKSVGLSPEFTLPRSFRNALVQSITGGNTQVFNHATKVLLEKAGLQTVISHDWWLYQVVQGCGGVFFYDPKPSLLYRQHSNSLVGANSSTKARVERIYFVFNGRFKKWNDINYIALTNIRHLLTKDNQDILDTFSLFRGGRLRDRVRLLEVCGLYRQTWQGTLSLWLATIINKV